MKYKAMSYESSGRHNQETNLFECLAHAFFFLVCLSFVRLVEMMEDSVFSSQTAMIVLMVGIWAQGVSLELRLGCVGMAHCLICFTSGTRSICNYDRIL